jgi:hypothetical protein
LILNGLVPMLCQIGLFGIKGRRRLGRCRPCAWPPGACGVGAGHRAAAPGCVSRRVRRPRLGRSPQGRAAARVTSARPDEPAWRGSGEHHAEVERVRRPPSRTAPPMDRRSTPRNRSPRISSRRAGDGDPLERLPRVGGLVPLFPDLCGGTRTGAARSCRGAIPLGCALRAPGPQVGGSIVALGGVGLAVYAA